MFMVLCAHEITENRSIACPVRCGKRRFEFNPDLLVEMSDAAIEECMKTEAVRLLLKHPYERRPDQCSDQAIAMGSNVTIGDSYRYDSFNIERPDDFQLDAGREYEYYSRKIQELLPDGGDSDGDGNRGGMDGGENTCDGSQGSKKAWQDLAGLWEEDEFAAQMINGIINEVKDWGSIGGKMAEKIIASTKAKINWKQVMSGFRASILSSRKKLTRMRPNRRTEFENMGSVREFDTRLLIAVDVSGSISSKTLSYFYGVIRGCFKYGITEVDVCQFDCGISPVVNIKKAPDEILVLGRGGTSFQEPIDYAVQNRYDGIVLLTDGYAPTPVLPQNCRTKLLWVCENKACFNAHHGWMEKLGRVCTMELA